MKKKRVLVLMCLALVLVIATVLVACNNTTSYTVTFSGDGIDTITKTVKEGNTVTPPSDITKEGYDAVWQLNGEDYDFSKAVNSDLTLSLKWVGKKYNVTLNAGGGATESPTVQVTFGSPFNLGVATTAEDKIFAGWEVNGTAVTSGTGEGLGVWSIAADTTVNAMWKKNPFTYTELPDGTYSVSANAPGDQYIPFGDAVAIPATYKNKPVTEIGSMTALTSYEIKIPASVKAISKEAFANNNYVEIVDLSEFAGTIGEKAFFNSKIKMIDLGKTTSIGNQAFKNSALTIVAVPATVTALGDEALLSDSIMEIGFAGEFPTLGANVFGDGRRTDGSVTMIAAKSAWETLVGISINDDNTNEVNQIISQKTGLQAATMRHYSAEEIAASLKETGILREASTADDKAVVFRGIGFTAVLYDYNSVSFIEMFESTHLYKNIATLNLRETYVLNYEDNSVVKVEVNDKQEFIYQNVLYDYVGSELVYSLPSNVTKIAGGAGFMNQSVRFIEIGDSTTEVGEYAFALTNIFGVRFGEKIAKIGDNAFFGSDYLQQIVFTGSTAPEIGTAAFCTTIGTGGIGPSLLCTKLAMYADCKVYTPLSASGWWGDPDCQPFIDALNASLSDIENLPSINDEVVSYKSQDFKQLTASGSYFYVADKTFDLECGTVTMLGTANEGYAYIKYAENSGYKGSGYARYTSLKLPGYSEYANEDPKLLECFFLTSSGLDSFKLNGRFGENGFELRGNEAGSYGEIGKDTFSFDGFGKFSFFGEDGTTTEGNYTVNGATITFDTLTDSAQISIEQKTLTYNGVVMTALGGEAGVYYDVNNAAKLILDGKAYTEGANNYAGKLTLTFKGQTIETGYTITKTEIKFALNGTEKSWTYSRTSADVVSGYYGNYEDNLKFKVVENTLIDTFTNGDITLSLDGYYTATVNGTDGFYRTFGESNSILLIVNDEIKIAYLNLENKTFEYATAEEAGKWYVTTSANYAWYFDGNGNLLYFSGDEYVSGTYVYDEVSKSLSVVYNGNAALNNEKGEMDAENGIGSVVYCVGTSNSYVAISRTPFEKFGYSYYMNAYAFISAVNSNNEIITTSPYFYFAKSGNTLFIYTSGNKIIIKSFEGELAGKTVEFEYTVVKESNDIKTSITATYAVTFTDVDGTLKASVSAKDDYYNAVGTVKSKDGATQYTVSWIDATHVVVWKMGSWGGEVLVSGTVAGGSAAEFVVGEYKVTGYGTENATIEKIEAPEA